MLTNQTFHLCHTVKAPLFLRIVSILFAIVTFHCKFSRRGTEAASTEFRIHNCSMSSDEVHPLNFSSTSGPCADSGAGRSGYRGEPSRSIFTQVNLVALARSLSAFVQSYWTGTLPGHELTHYTLRSGGTASSSLCSPNQEVQGLPASRSSSHRVSRSALSIVFNSSIQGLDRL